MSDPFLPYDRMKQVGIREIPVDTDKIFMINGWKNRKNGKIANIEV